MYEWYYNSRNFMAGHFEESKNLCRPIYLDGKDMKGGRE